MWTSGWAEISGRTAMALLALVVAAFSAHASPASTDPASKVAGRLLDRMAQAEPTEFIVVLHAQTNLDTLPESRDAKVSRAVNRLKDTAATTQADLLDWLTTRGIPHRSYWIANLIWVRAPAAVALEIARHEAVAKIEPNDAATNALPEPDSHEAITAGIEPSLSLVGAPDVWAMGYTGQGVVVAGADTGYEWDHPALQSQYRGWNGSSASHDYHWHDAIHVGGGTCGADSPFPCDDHNHGTHTMGTMVGDDGVSNQIGMAPGARWIGCRNMNVGAGTPTTYIECFQWFVAPTDLAGLNPDPSLAPHVINNSWTCTPGEGCSDVTILQTVVENVRAAGILVVASAGNGGAGGCSTLAQPPAIYDASFSVAATDLSDVIATFSSRGPVTSDGSQRLKPDISAPGEMIRSSKRNATYGYSSGTSMAGPHVVGLAALLISANPGLAGNVPALETLIRQSAVPLTTNEGCGGDDPAAVPNHTFGYGRIDALAAIELAARPVPTLAPLGLWIGAMSLAIAGLLRLTR